MQADRRRLLLMMTTEVHNSRAEEVVERPSKGLHQYPRTSCRRC